MNQRFEDACVRTLNCCRDLYNAALEQRIAAYKQGHSVGFSEQSRQLTDAREIEEVGGILRSFQEGALRRLDRAYQAFFRRVKSKTGYGFPRFKGYERYDSFTTTHSGLFRLQGDRLIVLKLGSCRLRLSRPIQGRPRTLTIKRQWDGWYALIACDNVEPRPLPVTGARVGVDVGLESFATLSTGETIENPRWFRKGEARLASAQQRLSLKKRGSESRKRARRLVAKAHAKIRRQRDWFHWQQARSLVARFDLIAVEKLNVKRLAHGNLAKSIHDAGWAGFILKVIGKAEEADRLLARVNSRFTSQDCSGCGKRLKKTLAERWHSCACGAELSRDHNAAINILVKAWPDLKIEPARA